MASTEANPQVSIIIPAKNGRRHICELLDGIYAQAVSLPFEVILIDSGSVDGTPEMAGRYPLRVVRIAPSAFNHGTTRNLGGQLANPASRYLVFLTQDATPLSGWLENLLAPLEMDPTVTGSFSRHVPRPGCNPILARQMTQDWEQSGTPRRVVKRIEDPADFAARKLHYIYFANTSSCLRRSVWQQYPFPVADFAEDMRWAETVLLAGYALVYEPASAVLHSHSYSLFEHCRQNYDHARAIAQMLRAPSPSGPQAKKLIPGWENALAVVMRDWRMLWSDRRRAIRSRLYWSVYSPLWHGAAGLGMWLGATSPHLGRHIRHWLSRQDRLRGRP